ncbi:PTS transporter subunit EIIC [Halanaerobaculum tunisiense]
MNIFKRLQKVGKALMTPVSVLPAAGILVAFGRMLMGYSGLVGQFGEVIFNGGLSIFERLPLIFALGIAVGFAGEAIAGLAAGVGYVVYARVVSTIAEIINLSEQSGGSVETINTGVFGGIIIGVVAAYAYENFYDTELPEFLGFFAGKRLVPIITAISSLVVAAILAFLWPPIQLEINQFAGFAMDSSLGPALYAAGKRALIPVGLHHVYYPPFLYEFGRFITETGEVLRGGTARYFAGDPTAGYFMAAEYPLMLFGLPAACGAMYLRADQNKKAVAGIMSTAALTSILTGITEPIEFSFIFVAPPLYIFHILGGFLSGILTNLLQIRLGYTFSASLIDYILGISNAGNQVGFWLIVGPAIGALYFTVFYVTIPLFDFKTPGRGVEKTEDQQELEVKQASPVNNKVTKETNKEEEEDEFEYEWLLDSEDRALLFVDALGGIANIEDVDACVTRLRVEVITDSKVDEAALKELGASGVMKMRGGVQVVIGPECNALQEEIEKLL